MRSIRLVLYAALGLALFTGSSDAGEPGFGLDNWIKRPSAWAGHGIGSSYTEVTKTKLPGMPKMPNMPNVPGMPKGGVMETTTKTTLIKIESDAYVLRRETISMGQKTVSEDREPKFHKPKGDIKSKITAAGEGPIVVDGKSYTCKIWKVKDWNEFMGGMDTGEGGARQSFGPATVWEHADSKIGVLQIQTTVSSMGRAHSWQWITTKLGLTRTVGGHSFKAREVSLSNSMMRGKHLMVMAPGFPGGNLSSTMESVAMGMKTNVSTQVTAYVKKPLAVTTPEK